MAFGPRLPHSPHAEGDQHSDPSPCVLNVLPPPAGTYIIDGPGQTADRARQEGVRIGPSSYKGMQTCKRYTENTGADSSAVVTEGAFITLLLPGTSQLPPGRHPI